MIQIKYSTNFFRKRIQNCSVLRCCKNNKYQIKIMGGKGSKNEGTDIDYEEWETIGQIHDAKVVRSNKGRGEAELHQIVLDPRYDTDREAEIYNYRQKINNSLVKCYGYESNTGKKTTLCGNEQNCRVLTERIPKRWNQIPQITFPESIYALSQSLAGYEQLHEKVGSFQISPTMMGLNNKGEMKVWLNDNFANNHPSDQRPMLQTTGVSINQYGFETSESAMVRSIIDIIEQKCENGKFPQNFKNVIDKNSDNFESIQSSIEDYAVTNKIYIPSRMNTSYLEGSSVLQNQYDAYTNSNLMKFQQNTNRFTYTQNGDQSDQFKDHGAIYAFERNGLKETDAYRPTISQTNQFHQSDKFDQLYPPHSFNLQGSSTSQKRYTYKQTLPNYPKEQIYGVEIGSAKVQNKPIFDNNGQYRYTTYEHNRPVQYQPMQTSQVDKHF